MSSHVDQVAAFVSLPSAAVSRARGFHLRGLQSRANPSDVANQSTPADAALAPAPSGKSQFRAYAGAFGSGRTLRIAIEQINDELFGVSTKPEGGGVRLHGLTISFPSYGIAPYMMGPTHVDVSPSEAKALFRPGPMVDQLFAAKPKAWT